MSKYTDEQTKEMVEAYVSSEDKSGTVAKLAEKYKKTIPSIIAKLSCEEVYIAKTVRKEKRVRKADVMNEIIEILELNADLMDSMEKMTLTALQELRSKI